ncbi:hypothetical protein CC2G_003132 [Coprinopsis cinerea AmutBmut pab1-1]|nr:hypothetical protein CC2G_003132 [Coprinopsis cinerea AmutBmut pab1-1]
MPSHFPFPSLPMELQYEILTELNAQDLQTVKACVGNLASDEILHRFCKLLSSFGLDPQAFRDAMKQYNAIIAGSAALAEYRR